VAWREAHGSELQAMVPEPARSTSSGQADRFHLERLPAAHNPDGFRVRIRDLPARTVAYTRVLDPYRGDVPDDQSSFEAWIGRPFAHGTEHFELYAQLPIERA
jgi:hypothetical protein